MRGYFPLIRKDSITHIHGLAVSVKEGLPFVQDLSLENSADSYLCFQLALLHSVSYFFLYRSPSSLLCTVFDSISSNIDEILLINPSAKVFIFGDFNDHHKDWLTYSGGTDRPGELCYNFSISNDLTQMVDFPTRIPDCDSHRPALLDLFISSEASICSIDFPMNSKQDAPFHRMAYDYSRADWNGLRDHLRDVPWGISLNSVLLLLLVTFVSRLRLKLMYISLIVRIRSKLSHLHGFQQLVLLL